MFRFRELSLKRKATVVTVKYVSAFYPNIIWQKLICHLDLIIQADFYQSHWVDSVRQRLYLPGLTLNKWKKTLLFKTTKIHLQLIILLTLSVCYWSSLFELYVCYVTVSVLSALLLNNRYDDYSYVYYLISFGRMS